MKNPPMFPKNSKPFGIFETTAVKPINKPKTSK